MITKKEILYYEVSSSWWAKYISNSFLQGLVGSYFAWKVNIKYRRYEHSLEVKELKRLLEKTV